MSFKENLKKKIKIDRLARRVVNSLGPVGSEKKIDRDAMRALLEIAGYHSRTRRFTEVYAHDFDAAKGDILVLDNELKIFKTSFSDVMVRKSPTVTEMLNVFNIKKILNDTDVVAAKGADSVEKIRTECISGLDLTCTSQDIEEICSDGCRALNRKDSDGVLEALMLFAELLGLTPPPARGVPAGIAILGREIRAEGTPMQYGPVILYVISENRLNRFKAALSGKEIGKTETFQNIAFGDRKPDFEGDAVFEALKEEVLQSK